LSGTFAPEHWAQLICYLKFWKLDLGILLDFGKESLVFQRVLYTPSAVPIDVRSLLARQVEAGGVSPLIEPVGGALQRIYDEYGLGYRDTTYKGLVQAELVEEGLICQATPTTTVSCAGQTLGEADLDCFMVGGEVLVRVLALHERLRAMDRAVVQSYLKHLHLRSGVLVNFGKKHLDVQAVWG
jgi:GxxExxY protein